MIFESIRERAQTERHTHVAGDVTGQPTDTCSVCGMDLRDAIHLRSGERAETDIDADTARLHNAWDRATEEP